MHIILPEIHYQVIKIKAIKWIYNVYSLEHKNLILLILKMLIRGSYKLLFIF